jgi:hypothetical protein
MGELIAWFAAEILGRLLGLFSRNLDKLPDRDFSQATTMQKLGRLTMCAAVLIFLLGPLLWLAFK